MSHYSVLVCRLSVSANDRKIAKNKTKKQNSSATRREMLYQVSPLHLKTGGCFQLSGLCGWSSSRGGRPKPPRSAYTPLGSGARSGVSPVLWGKYQAINKTGPSGCIKAKHDSLLVSNSNQRTSPTFLCTCSKTIPDKSIPVRTMSFFKVHSKTHRLDGPSNPSKHELG